VASALSRFPRPQIACARRAARVVPRSRLYNSNVLVPWFQARGDWSFAPGGSTQGFKKAGTSVKSVGKKVLKPAAKLKAAIMGGDDARSARGVAPESMFLIDQNGNSDMREQADLRGHLHLRYESEFQHLRDLIVGQEDDSTYQEAFDEANAELFDEGSAEKALGWPADCIQAAKRVFTRKEQLNLWRHFVATLCRAVRSWTQRREPCCLGKTTGTVQRQPQLLRQLSAPHMPS
jgi:hypothetical protein